MTSMGGKGKKYIIPNLNSFGNRRKFIENYKAALSKKIFKGIPTEEKEEVVNKGPQIKGPA